MVKLQSKKEALTQHSIAALSFSFKSPIINFSINFITIKLLLIFDYRSIVFAI